MGRVYDIETGQPLGSEPQRRSFNEYLLIGTGGVLTAIGGVALATVGETHIEKGDLPGGISLTAVGIGAAVLAFRKLWDEIPRDSLSDDE